MAFDNSYSAFGFRSQRKVIKPATHQTGEPKAKQDREKVPLQAGKRISQNGKVYYEYRRNRSSLHGRTQ